MTARAARRLALGLLLLAGAAVLGLLLVAERLLTPERRRPWPTPAALGLPFEELSLRTADGLLLAAWIVEPPPPVRATVLLLHAKDGCRSARRMAWLAARGFRSLALDHRAHGESEGRFLGFGQHERADVDAARELAGARWPDEPLLAWGTSLGAAAALASASAGDVAGRPFDGLILESLYADLETAFANRVRLHAGDWALPLLGGVRWALAWRGDLDPERLAPRRLLPRVAPTARVLLATGEHDAHATRAELVALAAAAPEVLTFVVPGAAHEDLLAVPAWERRVEEFLAHW